MNWKVKLGGELEFCRDGLRLPAAPNRTVEVLLFGLLSNHPRSMSRTELAKELYAGSTEAAARNALRQSIHRLKQWIGAECLQIDGNSLRIVAETCEFELSTEGGSSLPRRMIASGIDHPWMKRLRPISEAIANDTPTALGASYANTVIEAAAVDPVIGRRLLVAGASIAETLPIAEMMHAINATQPLHGDDPLFLEHSEVASRLYFRMGRVDLLCRMAEQSHRIALRSNDHRLAIRYGSLAVFAEIEAGAIDRAQSILQNLSSYYRPDSPDLLYRNARVCGYWDCNDLQNALTEAHAGFRDAESADAATQVHYWANFALLNAEAGDRIAVAESVDIARSLMQRQWAPNADMVCQMAEATIATKFDELDLAADLYDSIQKTARRREYAIAEWYALEGLSEVRARRGDGKAAINLWDQVESKRLRTCIALTPRVQAQKARVYRSA